jgi:hypothetical protein
LPGGGISAGAPPPAPSSPRQRDDAARQQGRRGQGDRHARGGEAIGWRIER